MMTIMIIFVVLLLTSVDAFIGNAILKSNVRSLRKVDMMAGEFVTHFTTLSVPCGRGISLRDITTDVQGIVDSQGIKEGVVTVLSKHSTVSVCIQEFEPRFVDDARQFLLKLVPPDYPYLHNDLEFRVGPDDWPGGDEAWREFRRTQPVNAHSHLIQMIVGTSESIPISEGAMQIGTYQNIIVVDADGVDKSRTICVQVMGTK